MKTYGKLSFDKANNQWVMTDIPPHVSIKLKQIFSFLNKTSVAPYRFKNTPENASDLKWFMQRYPMQVTDMEMLNMQQRIHSDTIERLESILLPEHKPSTFKLREGFASRDYQSRGVDLYYAKKRILIGDDLGLGKTMIGILSGLKPGTLPMAISVQSHLTIQWKNEIERFTELKVHIIKGTKPYSLPPADVYIFKYSCLAGWVDVFNTGMFQSAVFDECQELRRSASNKYEGAKALSQNVTYCLGLSATPIYNYGDEIYCVMNIINPGALGTWEEFSREWTRFSKIVKDPAALGAYLRDEFLMLRRTREDVGRELPPINKIVHTVDYDEKEVHNAESLARILAIKATTGSFVERGQAARELDIYVRHMTGVSKAKNVADYVRILLEAGEPVLLAGWHRDVYEIWQRELSDFNPVMYTGTESPKQKEESKAKFLSGESNLFIISLRSGVGLDGLQHRCKMVVFGELDWSPKVHDQVIARADRDGQKEQVTAIYLVSDFGSDPVIIDILGLKSSQSESIVNPFAAVKEQYTDESRIKLLAEQFLTKRSA